MATQSPAAAPILSPDSAHGFFKTFPRELRDSVYDLLYQEVHENVDGLQLRIRAVCAGLRFVSRQFKLEYDERSTADGRNQLEITDNMAFDLRRYGKSEGGVVPCPALATHTTELALNLIACKGGESRHYDCCADSNIRWHTNWINAFLQSLPHLREVRVRLDFVNPNCIDFVLEGSRMLQALPKLSELRVMGSTSLQAISKIGDSVHCATWTEQYGLQQHHDAIEAYCARI